MFCVAAAEDCDRAARSRGSCNRRRPCGSIAGCASGYRGCARHDNAAVFHALCSRCRRLRSSGTLAGILQPLETLAGLSQAAPAATGAVPGTIMQPFHALCSRCRRLRSSGTLAGILRPLESLRVYRRLRQRLHRLTPGTPPTPSTAPSRSGCPRSTSARTRRRPSAIRNRGSNTRRYRGSGP